MDALDILINEHDNIKKVLHAVMRDCEEMAEGKAVNIALYREVIDFVRNYADKHHHRKEETDLFSRMADENKVLQEGPIKGMLLEHDLGRMYIRRLEDELKLYEDGDKSRKAYIIANVLSYAIMLDEHIKKEDNVMYEMARRILSPKVKEELLLNFKDIDEKEESRILSDKYVRFANSL